MERIKDWKSYQKTLNKRKNKKNRFVYFVKYIVLLALVGAFLYGFVKFYYYGMHFFLSKNKPLLGTGIRPIKFIKASAVLKKRRFNGFSSGNVNSLKSLKRYFRYHNPVFKTIKNGRYIQKIGNYTVVYTLDPSVQEEAEKVFKEYAVPYGVLAAVNPETGAVLGFASYAYNKKKSAEISPLIAYPPGSIAKIITATAAIESKGFYPGLNICFNGTLYGTDKTNWEQNIGTGSNDISFKEAFAKSCDVAFGKIAGYYVGRKLLFRYFDKFNFNKKIPFILNLQESKAYIPKKFYQLELTGAGFENVRITPIQAAMVAGVAINGGRLIEPYIIKEIMSTTGKIIYKHKGIKVIGYPVTLKTAYVLKQMMIATVTNGIAHSDFYSYNGSYMLPGVVTGGKTGTISGNHPTGLYQWFAGFGEENKKKIALSALVVEKPVWRIEGGGVSEKTLLAYFF